MNINFQDFQNYLMILMYQKYLKLFWYVGLVCWFFAGGVVLGVFVVFLFCFCFVFCFLNTQPF